VLLTLGAVRRLVVLHGSHGIGSPMVMVAIRGQMRHGILPREPHLRPLCRRLCVDQNTSSEVIGSPRLAIGGGILRAVESGGSGHGTLPTASGHTIMSQGSNQGKSTRDLDKPKTDIGLGTGHHLIDLSGIGFEMYLLVEIADGAEPLAVSRDSKIAGLSVYDT
jgi:hypothetical protein